MTPTQTLPERPKNLSGLLQIINRWKIQVISLTVLAAIISAVVSYLLPNEYKSTTVFYPTSLRAVDPDRIIEGEKIDVAGSTEDIDRIITIGQSQPLAEFIINKFKLYRDYGIENMNDDASKQYVLDQFSANLTIVHNERDAIELTFFSKDKERASAVANAIVKHIDHMTQQLTLENREKVLAIFRNQYEVLEKDFFIIRDSLQKSRKLYGVIGTDKEARYLGKALIETETELIAAKGELEVLSRNGSADGRINTLKARIHGLEKAFAGLRNKNGNLLNLESYTAGTDVVYGLFAQFNDLSARYIKAKTAYQNAKLGIIGNISTIYVVQKAYPAMRKAKPIRWLIVVASTMLTFILAVIFVSLYEMYNKELRRLSV
jgi:uncharacterized protein involved in exopolysaccharide biosynthesis